MKSATRVPDMKFKQGDKNQPVIMRGSVCNIYAGCRVNEKIKYYLTKQNFVHAFVMTNQGMGLNINQVLCKDIYVICTGW